MINLIKIRETSASIVFIEEHIVFETIKMCCGQHSQLLLIFYYIGSLRLLFWEPLPYIKL